MGSGNQLGAGRKKACVACAACTKFFQERVFQTGFSIGFPCALLGGGLKALAFYSPAGSGDFLRGIIVSTAYSSFTFLIGLLVVFRTSQSYARYWDGCDAAYLMMSDFFDAVSNVFAFCKSSKVEETQISEFQHVVVRLFSLLHAFILADLESVGEIGGTEKALNYELIDIEGIDEDSLLTIQQSSHKVDLAMQWIQSIFVDGMNKGILNVPPPVVTRVFQEMNAGISQFHKALKIAESPFPFPYTAACEMCLIIHWLVTPFVAVTWTDHIWSAAILTFMQVFILWSLHAIATELENPFEQDMNDLDMFAMQRDLNARLLQLMEHAKTDLPTLSPNACMVLKSLRGRTSTRTGFCTAMDHVASSKSLRGEDEGSSEAASSIHSSEPKNGAGVREGVSSTIIGTTGQTLGTSSLHVSESTRSTRMRTMRDADPVATTITARAIGNTLHYNIHRDSADGGAPIALKVEYPSETSSFMHGAETQEETVIEVHSMAAVAPSSHLSSREAAHMMRELSREETGVTREPTGLSNSEVSTRLHKPLCETSGQVNGALLPLDMPETHTHAHGRGRGCADCKATSCPKWI